jgi:hypothetical protein
MRVPLVVTDFSGANLLHTGDYDRTSGGESGFTGHVWKHDHVYSHRLEMTWFDYFTPLDHHLPESILG